MLDHLNEICLNCGKPHTNHSSPYEPGPWLCLYFDERYGKVVFKTAKPRVWRERGLWYCSKATVIEAGMTPMLAYFSMMGRYLREYETPAIPPWLEGK